MKKRLADILLIGAKILPVGVMVVLVVLYLTHRDTIRLESLLSYTPENLWLAALLLLAMYAVKSLSIFFPLLALYAAAGLLFPLPLALLVNLAGLWVCVSVPYGVGRLAGEELVKRLQKRYKRIAYLHEIQRNSAFFFSFFLRIINCLPGDVVSMVLGASGTAYGRYTAGSLLGLLPVMTAATVAGASLSDPTSPAFIITACMVVLLSAGSFILWRITARHSTPRR